MSWICGLPRSIETRSCWNFALFFSALWFHALIGEILFVAPRKLWDSFTYENLPNATFQPFWSNPYKCNLVNKMCSIGRQMIVKIIISWSFVFTREFEWSGDFLGALDKLSSSCIYSANRNGGWSYFAQRISQAFSDFFYNTNAP